jgi:hypothetical protein
MELGRRRVAGKRIGDHQVGIYKKLRKKLRQEAAAAKVGISVRSARRLEDLTALPSQREARAWRTRPDPFEAVWQSEIVPLLEAAPGLTATTLLEEVQRRYPGQYDAALLRTLQRRVRTWNAAYGSEREVFFAQAHPPGRKKAACGFRSFENFKTAIFFHCGGLQLYPVTHAKPG